MFCVCGHILLLSHMMNSWSFSLMFCCVYIFLIFFFPLKFWSFKSFPLSTRFDTFVFSYSLLIHWVAMPMNTFVSSVGPFSQNFTLVIFLMHHGTWAPCLCNFPYFLVWWNLGQWTWKNSKWIIHTYSPVPISIRKRKRSSRATCYCKLSDHWESHCLRSKFPSMVKQNGNLRKSEFNVLDLYFHHWLNSPETHQFSFLAYSLTPILIKKKYVLFFLFCLFWVKKYDPVYYFLMLGSIFFVQCHP